MSDKPLNVAIAGIGVMGMVAVRAFNRSSKYRVIAIADQSSAALERARDEVPNAVQFSSADNLVTSKNLDHNEIDLVAVLTPPNSHARLAIRALQARRHVFCEKPLALNSLEAKQMVAEADIARTSSVFAIVGHQLRYNVARRWIKDQISSGAIGKPQHIQIIANFPKLYSAEFSWWTSL
jgi:predicted dehydrogenase